jgi:hypothetical protein
VQLRTKAKKNTKNGIKTVMNMSNKDLLKNLADKRTAHFLSLKKNRDHSHSIIGEQLYSKKSHFVFELLQNAEDEKAKKVKISFDKEKLIFEHNGNPFDINDIDSITSFGNNERKKLKPNAIGRFGIGFKSVFSVTQKPEIKSGDFHFAISDFIVPNLIDSEKSKTTIITLPFKSSQQHQIASDVEATLKDLNSTYLLFLNNISLIEIANLNNGESRFIKLKEGNYKNSNLKLFSISEEKNQKDFLLFEDTVSIAKKKLPIKIAFTISRKLNRIAFLTLDSSPLFAFFATEKETNLPFYIHAPFLTTPARDNIISHDERNQKLFSALTELMVAAIEQLKTNNLIDLNTWLVFPCNISFYKNEIYKMFCDNFFRYLTNKKTFILPSDDNGFCHVYSAMRVRTNEFKTLISSKEAKSFFGRTEWVTQKINNTDFQTINTWIEQQYKVPTVGFKELCEKVDDSFFKNKSDEWLLKFYQCISDTPELWRAANKGIIVGPLRDKAFIRTTKNKTVNPFDANGNLNVYLPTEGTSDYQFVKSIFLADKDARRLFKSLNITTPDLIAEVNEHVIPRIAKTENPYRGIREDIQKIFRAIRRADDVDAEAITDRLKSISWLLAKNNLTKKTTLNKPDEIYFPTRDLISLLGKSSTSTFLDSSLFSDTKSKQNARSVLEDVGVFFRPRRFYKEDDDIVFENRIASTQNYWNGNDIELEGLKEYLGKTVDKKASINLWSILIKSSEDWKTSGYANTKFIQQLKETKWLFNKFGQRQKPSEITPSELDEAYEDSNTLMTALEFKADAIKDFELEHDGKFLSNDELQKMKDEMTELKREIERLKNQYEPTQEDESENDLPDIDAIEISDELSSDDIQPRDDDIPDDHQTDDYTDNGNNGSVGVMTSSVPTKRQRKIGVRGEEFVLKLLRESYKHDNSIEVCDLNEDDKLGVGCDIIIKKNGVAQTLIEVKATEGGYENKFKVSEKQWRTAIKSHLDNDEPEYHIYCVYYAGGTSPQHIIIKDPVEWMMKKQLRFVEQWFNVRSIKRQ